MNSKVITVFALLFTDVFAEYPPEYYLPPICSYPLVGAPCTENKGCCSSSCENEVCTKLPFTLDCCKEAEDMPPVCQLTKIGEPCTNNGECCTSACDKGKCGGGAYPLDCCKIAKH